MTVEKITKDLMGLTISELTQVQNMIQDMKVMKAKSGINVGDKVYIVQKTKRDLEQLPKLTILKRLLKW